MPRAPRPKRFQKTAEQISRSGFERKIMKDLKEKGIEYKYEAETLRYEQPAEKRRYVVDFILPNGVIVEAKGKFTSADRKKMLLVKAQHPDRDIRMLFMRNNKLTKKSKTTYTDWCDKNGIVSAVNVDGHIPHDWLD